MKNLNKLRQAIIKEIPEIVELKFGCRFKHNYDIWFINCDKCNKKGVFTYSCSGEKHSLMCEDEDSLWEYKYHFFSFEQMKKEKEYFEIIGRPITLADVLRVLMKIKLPIEEVENYPATIMLIDLVSKWNLSKNNLNDQSKETIDFLVKIILKEDE